MPKPIARWNPARDVWETQTTGLFCEHSDVWSETWPPSGMWDGGTVYALPTWEPRTDGSACSSSPGLLPTPNYGLGEHRRDNGQPPERRRAQGRQVSTADVLCHLPAPTSRDWKDGACADADVPTNGLLGRTVVRELLPTPVADHSRGLPQPGTDYSSLPNAVMELLPTPTTTQRGTDANLDTREGARANLHNTVEALLPTPRATDGTKGGPNQRGSSGDLMLPSAVQLLPTPRAQNGNERNQTIYARDLSQPQNLENALAMIYEED